MDDYEGDPEPSESRAQCRQCYRSFSSRNQLFIHIRKKNHFVEDGAGVLNDAPWRSWNRFDSLSDGITTDIKIIHRDLQAAQPQLYMEKIELRGYTSWLEWKHEFVIIHYLLCPPGATDKSSRCEFYIRLERQWAAPMDWRAYVPSGWTHTPEGLMSNIPTIGSAKPSSGKVEILPLRPEDEGTTCIALLSCKVNAEALTSRDRRDVFTSIAAMLYRRIGNYALLGANCWSYSRTVLALAFYQMARDRNIVEISMNGRRSNYAAFREVYATDPWTLESAKVWHQEISLTHSWPNPEHHPSLLHRIALVASSLIHSSRTMLNIPPSAMIWQWVPVGIQVGNIIGYVYSVLPFNIGKCELRLDPAFGNPPLWVDRQYESLINGEQDVDQNSPVFPRLGPAAILVSDPIFFKKLFSITISLPLTLPIDDPPPSPLSVAIVCDDPKTWIRPEGSRMYVDSRQCSNMTSAQPTDPLRVVLLRRHAIPFDSPMFQVVETFPPKFQFDGEPPATDHDIRGVWKIDPVFFEDGILPGDRISIWLEPGSEGIEVGSNSEMSILYAVATWQKLPMPRFSETGY